MSVHGVALPGPSGYVWYGVGLREVEHPVLVREQDVQNLDMDIFLAGVVVLRPTDEWVEGALVHERVRPT